MHTYLVAFFFSFCVVKSFLRSLQSAHVKAVHQVTSYAANCFLKRKRPMHKTEKVPLTQQKKYRRRSELYTRERWFQRSVTTCTFSANQRVEGSSDFFSCATQRAFLLAFYKLDAWKSLRRRRMSYEVRVSFYFINQKKWFQNQFSFTKFIHFSALILILSFRFCCFNFKIIHEVEESFVCLCCGFIGTWKFNMLVVAFNFKVTFLRENL